MTPAYMWLSVGLGLRIMRNSAIVGLPQATANMTNPINEARRIALTNLDISWARSQIHVDKRRDVKNADLLVILHKARFEASNIERGLRLQSRIWLEERGETRFGGAPWPPTGTLEGDPR
jgi:hypothetical protein